MFQKTATAVAYCKRGHGVLRVNGRPLDLVEPRLLQYKLQEPILLLGKVKYLPVIRIILHAVIHNNIILEGKLEEKKYSGDLNNYVMQAVLFLM